MDERLRALNRFGLGARIGERDRVAEPRSWLRAQLDAGAPEPLEGPAPEELGEVLSGLRAAQRSRDQERLARARRSLRDVWRAEVGALLTHRARTERPFVERLVAFWSNHFCVSTLAKPPLLALAGHYERVAIRPHVLGRFDEMVLASARHPAMLLYLDNAQSVGPRSRAGRGSARRGDARGLNENYARELLELHTLGVDGGYTQSDVEELARVLTGWSAAGLGPAGRRDEALGFAFRPMVHEPGDKRVLGRRYREDGVAEGERVIRDLCAHPATARFVAGKLVRHFVSDEPPADAVEALAQTFVATGGDLRAVAGALVDLEAAWRPETRKFRAPQDWLVAVFRAVRAREVPEQALPILQQLRQPVWAPPAPKGYGDLEREWTDPDALMNRAELARSLAARAGRPDRLDPTRLLEVVDVAADDPLRAMLADRSVPAPERLALALGGPAFQWR